MIFLERDEEQKLAERAIKGDKEASDKLASSHLNYVIKIAKIYRRSGVPMPDLIQEGMVGLMRAIYKFNPDRNVRLSTYAMWWIRASIQEHVIRSWSIVRLSTTSAHKSLFLNLRRIAADLMGGADTISDEIVSKLAERFGTSASEVRNLAYRIAYKDQSLDKQASDDEKLNKINLLICPSENAEEIFFSKEARQNLILIIEKAMKMLPDRERFIIRHRYLVEVKKTFSVLGEELNLSKDRVRQLEARALETLRKLIKPSIGSANFL